MSEIKVFVHNLVYKCTFSEPVIREMIAMEFGGLFSMKDHAGPTSVNMSGPVNAHFRLFKGIKIILSGCKSEAAVKIAIWNFCARISALLSGRGIMKAVYPKAIKRTNTMATGYCPFTFDLVGISNDLNDLGERVIYDPGNIKYVRVYYIIDKKKITLALSPTGTIVFMGGDIPIIHKAIEKILPILQKNKLADIDALVKRKIRVDIDGSEEIGETEIIRKRRKKRKVTSSRKK